MNFSWDAMSVKPSGNVNLARQSSIYSLTFDELQSTVGGVGKDFGSMNMDELLKNIWNVEETQALTCSAVGGGGEGPNSTIGSNLQRQSSLTLPRTLSQRKVDEVWKELMKDDGNSGSSIPQRQPTLGEVTLEEFLVRAGVVKEDVPNHVQQIERPNNNEWFSGFSRSNNSTNLLRFQQPNRNNGDMSDNINLVPKQVPVPVSVPLPPSSINLNHSQRPPPLFPKPTNVAFASSIHMLNNAQLGNPGRRGGMVGVQEHSMNGALVQNSVAPGVGMIGLSAANVTAPIASPGSKLSPDIITKRNLDPLLSPVAYGINRGRKFGAVEKVVERRQRRMIKNRESAARSRARKQAYTVELEAEVAKLKEVNEELQRKQAEFMEMQKSKEDMLQVNKIRYLRRTLTGPW
ncbi:unnamed protein product [Lathyrus oleraceus]|uniref:BZIP domain-containing protein n=1 Tax=Pisum sativum TaxID=3888 RepID=A0A9D4VNV4_PEA|nr:bZIP transcription factor 46-like [Pisum sativum]KAI5386981.1 hypothetical protein KIW84_073213 [Pisum sativum]